MKTAGSTRLTPRYLELANELEATALKSGAGAQLPSETALPGLWAVSRPTARAALAELERRHVIRRTRGSGTYVAQRIPYRVAADSAPSWSQTIRQAGHVPEMRVLSAETIRPDAQVRSNLDLPRSEKVVKVVRLGLVDGRAAKVGTNYLPCSLAPHLEELLGSGTSIYHALRALGYQPERSWIQMELATAGDDIAELLEFEGRPAIWRGESCSVDATTGKPLECGVGWTRPDVLSFRFELRRSR
jgi:GntR family transcriptional regulator